MKKIKNIVALLLITILLAALPLSIAKGALATVNTLPSTTVKADSASVGGEVLRDNGTPIIERGIIYSTNSNPTIDGTRIRLGNTLGKYYYRLTGLSGNTRYYYAAYAINADGISYGITRSFATKKDITPPYIAGATVASTNAYIDVNLSEYVYGINRIPLTLNSFRWTFRSNGGGATALAVTSITRTDGAPITGSVMNVRFWISVTGVPSGIETIEIWPINGTTIYDSSGNAMAATSTTGLKYLNDKNAPQITSGILSATNTYMDVFFSQGVYGASRTPLTIDKFLLQFNQNGGTATGVTISSLTNSLGGNLVGGETVIRVWLNVKGTPSGDEMVAIGPLNGTSIYDENGNAMSVSQTTGPKLLNDLLSPAISGRYLDTNNAYVDISLTQGVYSSIMGPLGASDFMLLFNQNGGNASSITIDYLTRIDGTKLIGGETEIRAYLKIDKPPSGVETIEILPLGPGSIMDINGNPMSETQTTGVMMLYDRLKPIITLARLSADNDYVDITISEGAYNNVKGPLSPSNLVLLFYQNGGGTTQVAMTGITKIDGAPLTGGETTVRVYLTIVGIPSGVEAFEIKPATAASIFDKAGNTMNSTETTKLLYLNSKSPIRKLTHYIKTATGKVAGTREATFIVGDKITKAIKLEVNSAFANPKVILNLNSDNNSFYFKEIRKSTGIIDASSIRVYKNGLRLPETQVNINKNSVNNTLEVTLNQSFINSDLVEVVYVTRLSLTDTALRSKIRPVYGVRIKNLCSVEWGTPLRYYSVTYPGPTGNDQFFGEIIVKASRVLK